MEDKFIESMIETSIKMMKRLADGDKLSPDELRFILLTRQLIQKNNKNKNNPLNILIEELKPVLPIMGTLLQL